MISFVIRKDWLESAKPYMLFSTFEKLRELELSEGKDLNGNQTVGFWTEDERFVLDICAAYRKHLNENIDDRR